MSITPGSPAAFAASIRTLLLQHGRKAIILHGLRSAGPYLLIELLMPGGTLIAFLLFLYRGRRSVPVAADNSRIRVACAHSC